MMKALALGSLCALVVVHGLNNRPVIGILTLPNDVSAALGHSYFPASYVKFIEAAGARVVPIPYDAPLATTQTLLKSLNGALFTGGGASFANKNGSLTVFSKTANAIFQESVNAALNGEIWPLHGTCLGHELIAFLASNFSSTTLTPGWDSENYTEVIKFTDAASSSRMYGSVPELRAIFATKPVAMNAHQQGVSPASFAAQPTLASRFTVLGTSVDRKGAEFVATMEALPPLNIYTTQFHPEKTYFEWWASEVMDHTWDSIRANSHVGYFFVNQTRSNMRKFPSPDAEAAALIYNYNATYTATLSPGFEQCYFFPKQ